MPVPVDAFDAPGAGDGLHTFGIVFRPRPEMLRKANEPLYIVRELRKLGELELVAETDTLPHLHEIEPDRPYIGWTGTLRTAATRAQVEEVFEFVTGDCEMEIVEADPAPAFGGIGDNMPAGALPGADFPAPAVEAGMPAAALPSEESAPMPPSSARTETPEAASAPKPAAAKAASTTTRIELERIDRVVNMVGELVIAQAMLGQIVHDLPEATNGRLMQILDEVIHHTRELKDSVMSMRAQPVGAVFQRMPRLVRELSTKTAKRVRLEMSGENDRGRPIDHRAPRRSADAYHPQRGRPRHRVAGGSVGRRQERGRDGSPQRRASRRPDRHRGPRRRRRDQFRAGAQEGARAWACRSGSDTQR